VDNGMGEPDVTVRAGARQFTGTIPAKTVATYVWAGAGDAGSGGGSARTGQIVGYGGKGADVAGANSANGTAVQLYGCNGSGAQS
jgi:glucosylceramidase